MTIDRDLIEDIESRLGMVAHNLGCASVQMMKIGLHNREIDRSRIDLEKVFKDWLTLRTKLQAAGVVSNVGGGT